MIHNDISYLAFYLNFGTVYEILPGIPSHVLSGILSDVLCGILSDTSSGILSGIPSGCNWL